MKPFSDARLAKMRKFHPSLGWGDDEGGFFRMNNITIIASRGEGWDHVSVSLADRCPTWEEMCRVKNAFFYPSECVIQYHPAIEEYVNYHPFCLHLWRPQNVSVPFPPKQLVGPS